MLRFLSLRISKMQFVEPFWWRKASTLDREVLWEHLHHQDKRAITTLVVTGSLLSLKGISLSSSLSRQSNRRDHNLRHRVRADVLNLGAAMLSAINDISIPSRPRVASLLLVEIATGSQMHHLLGEDPEGVQDVSHVGRLEIL